MGRFPGQDLVPRFRSVRLQETFGSYFHIFPKDKAERACFEYLVALMLASPNYQQTTKAKLERYCDFT